MPNTVFNIHHFLYPKQSQIESLCKLAYSGDKASFLSAIASIEPTMLFVTVQKEDKSKNTLLHYAAQYQLTGGFRVLLKLLKENKQLSKEDWITCLTKTNGHGDSIFHSSLSHLSDSINNLYEMDLTDNNEAIEMKNLIRKMDIQTNKNFHDLYLFVYHLKIFNQSGWYDLFQSKNHKQENILHYAIRENLDTESILRIFYLMGKENSVFMLCTRDQYGHSVLDYFGQYFDQEECLEKLIQWMGTERWNRLLEYQQQDPHHDITLHHVAHCQDGKALTFFISQINSSQRSMLFKENQCGETVCEVALKFIGESSLGAITKIFETHELISIIKIQASKFSLDHDIENNMGDQTLKDMFIKYNSLSLLLSYKYSTEIQTRSLKRASRIQDSIRKLLDEPSQLNKESLIKNVRFSEPRIQRLCSCFMNKKSIEIAELLEQAIKIPRCHTVIKLHS
ncbi:MAG: hypothetical protein CL816_04785 [Coxiellaceae bacterium]|nr:hypothetical protein [Coxiellaceae bacterium]